MFINNIFILRTYFNYKYLIQRIIILEKMYIHLIHISSWNQTVPNYLSCSFKTARNISDLHKTVTDHWSYQLPKTFPFHRIMIFIFLYTRENRLMTIQPRPLVESCPFIFSNSKGVEESRRWIDPMTDPIYHLFPLQMPATHIYNTVSSYKSFRVSMVLLFNN